MNICTDILLQTFQIIWFKDGTEISRSDRLYTQSVRRVHDNNDTFGEHLLATLSVATLRRDTVFSCHIAADPPEEQSMQVIVQGE